MLGCNFAVCCRNFKRANGHGDAITHVVACSKGQQLRNSLEAGLSLTEDGGQYDKYTHVPST